MKRLTFALSVDSVMSDEAESHRGSGTARFGWPGECCTTCVMDDLRQGRATLANPEDMVALADALERDDPYRGRGPGLRIQLRQIVAAHEARGVEPAEQLIVALETAARIGGPLAARMATAISLVFDAAGDLASDKVEVPA
jgi:hypothetical protein